MTEPSKQARDLAGIAWQMGHLDYERDQDKDVEVIAHRIDAALAEARQAGPQTTVTHELGKPGTCRVVSPDGALLFDGVDWSALTEARLERVANVTPCACSAQRERADKAEAERDELAATVERVRALADEWMFDTEFAHKAHYADEVFDALNGGESHE